ncbi:hypothetical protein Slin15195_G100180 [Septoria linicola]|uniref:PQ loop repeat protein n=1 Tax=Septoria linicola TaxID=215465 RepID=A0A9Q9ENK7_9PEZI|nr:hypothetical protein Slin14017_G063230 [Septoria linicola]USW56699.1 hypothetical protein Slin15195_G100180 [Septoria linicola]
MAPDLSQHCVPLQHPSWFPVTLAAVLVVGILISYLPQHFKIISRKSSEGISPWWVLLGGLSSIAAIGNIVTLPTSRADMLCCREIGEGPCAAALLGVMQIAVQFSCFMIIVFLYITFAPREEDGDTLSSSTATLTKPPPTSRPRDPLIVGSAISISLFLVAAISLFLVLRYPHHTQRWADILGTVSGVLAAVQYLPQIYFTAKIRDLKSLSIGTLIIQAPGAFLFAYSLFLRVGMEGWSTWLVYMVTGALQIVLLGMAFSFWTVKQRERREDEAAAADERSALLQYRFRLRGGADDDSDDPTLNLIAHPEPRRRSLREKTAGVLRRGSTAIVNRARSLSQAETYRNGWRRLSDPETYTTIWKRLRSLFRRRDSVLDNDDLERGHQQGYNTMDGAAAENAIGNTFRNTAFTQTNRQSHRRQESNVAPEILSPTTGSRIRPPTPPPAHPNPRTDTPPDLPGDFDIANMIEDGGSAFDLTATHRGA